VSLERILAEESMDRQLEVVEDLLCSRLRDGLATWVFSLMP
jgi:hypothetical protein